MTDHKANSTTTDAGPGRDHYSYTHWAKREVATIFDKKRFGHPIGRYTAETQQVLLLAEDVGRHNALDKILGEALLKGIPTTGRLLLTSGRISSEMLRKGAHMGTPFLISRTSPTTLSIEAAQRLGITLIGYVRRQSFNVYTHPQRLLYHHPAPAAPMALQP